MLRPGLVVDGRSKLHLLNCLQLFSHSFLIFIATADKDFVPNPYFYCFALLDLIAPAFVATPCLRVF